MRVRIDNSPFVERFNELRAAGVSAYEIAKRMGYVRSRNGRPGLSGDTARLKRHLGLMPNRPGNGYISRNRTVNLEVAERLCQALDLDPVDVGL